MQIIIGSPDPSFNPIELKIKNRYFKAYFEKEYYDINEKNFPRMLYFYVFHTIGERLQEAEPIIMQDPKYAYYYAFDLIRGRWSEAEPTIMKDAQWAYHYACDIIKERWLEAEPTIEKDSLFSGLYAQFFKVLI